MLLYIYVPICVCITLTIELSQGTPLLVDKFVFTFPLYMLKWVLLFSNNYLALFFPLLFQKNIACMLFLLLRVKEPHNMLSKGSQWLMYKRLLEIVVEIFLWDWLDDQFHITSRRENLSNVMRDMKIPYSMQMRLEFYLKTQNGKNHRDESGGIHYFLYSGGLQYSPFPLFFFLFWPCPVYK